MPRIDATTLIELLIVLISLALFYMILTNIIIDGISNKRCWFDTTLTVFNCFHIPVMSQGIGMKMLRRTERDTTSRTNRRQRTGFFGGFVVDWLKKTHAKEK